MEWIKKVFLFLLVLSIPIFWIGFSIVTPAYLFYDYKKHQKLHSVGAMTKAKVLERSYRPSYHSLKSTTPSSRKLTYTYQIKNEHNQLQTYTTTKEVSPYLYLQEEVTIYYCKNEVDFSDILHNGMHYRGLGICLFILALTWGFYVFLWCIHKNEQKLGSVSKPKGFGIFFLGIFIICLLLFNDLKKAVEVEFGYALPPSIGMID